MLDKIGWIPYSSHRGIGLPNIFVGDQFVRYFIHITHRPRICYLIKELTENEKQTSKNEYKFIELNYVDIKNLKFETIEFSTNEELFGLIFKFSSTNSEKYKRHFTIGKIIK